jgi:hypothetical protein
MILLIVKMVVNLNEKNELNIYAVMKETAIAIPTGTINLRPNEFVCKENHPLSYNQTEKHDKP